MLKYILLSSLLFTLALCHAQQLGDAPADAAIETRVLNDGYSLRLIGVAAKARGEKVESYKLILRHPDGAEDLVWNPPVTEPHNNSNSSPFATNDVTLFRPQSGIVKNAVLGVVIGKETWNTDTWWLRWDLKEKRMITMVMFFSQYGGKYDFIDENTMSTNNGTVTIDAQGRVFRNGKRYPRSYFVYEGQRQTTYWPIDQGGKIEVTENAQVWPFVARPAARNERPANPPAKADGNAPPPPKDQPPVAATPAASPLPPTPIAQTPASAIERQAPMWPWVAGILALVVIVTMVLKRRAH